MLRSLSLIFSSAAFLILSFPQTGWSVLAWFALVPWLLLLERKEGKAAFGWSYLCGFLFFAGTLGWFVYVTYAGAVLLIAYLAVYFAVFGWAHRFFRPLPFHQRLWVLACVWVSLEFVRSYFLTGFGWAMIGHTQYKNLLLIQVSDITGRYGVSFLVVLVNLLITESIVRPAAGIRKMQLAVLLVVAAVLVYGFFTVARFPQFPTTTVGVVQPNIFQDLKWDKSMQPWIVQKTIMLSNSLRASKPDLVVWPETSLPGVSQEVPHLTRAIAFSARQSRMPLLYGAITGDGKEYYNSAYLVSADGVEAGRYDKIHLVPFGEYMPMRWLLGWINNFVGLEDFSSGTQYTLLRASGGQAPFAVLICFEDTLGYLWRNFTNAGAQLIVNMTNDGWFRDTKAPFLHLQAAVFGAVENKRSLVRSANTGFSGFVDPLGRIVASVQNARHKQTFVSGTALARIPLASTKTFYTKYGDVFTWGCFLVILAAALKRRSYAAESAHRR